VSLRLCLAALFLTACAHDRVPPCRIGVVPAGGNRAAGEDPGARVDTACEKIPPAELAGSVPPGAHPLVDEHRSAWLARLNDAGTKFYGNDVAAGTTGLLACFEEVKDRPDLLPSEPADRARAYALLLVVFRQENGRDPAAGDHVAEWLAVHMPDMQPSVRHLPPPLAERALEVARSIGPEVNLLAPEPACEGDWLLVVDGLALLPAPATPLPPGDHMVWYECGPLRSWVRRIQLTEEHRLAPPEMTLEGGLHTTGDSVTAREDLPQELKGRVALDLARRTGSSGILLLPDSGDALLVTPDGESRTLRPRDGRYFVDFRSFSSRRTSPMAVAGWVLLPSSALLLAGGVASNLYYNHQMDRMDLGTVDLRNDAEAWRYTAIGGYAAASAAFTSAVLLFLLDSSE